MTKTEITYCELFQRAWDSVSNNMGTVVGLTIVYCGAIMASSMIPIIGGFVPLFLTPGYFYCVHRLKHRQEIFFNDFFWGVTDLNRLGHYAIMHFICSFGILLGFILLVIPGIYFLGAFFFAWPVFVVTRQDGVFAVKESMRLAKNRWWYIFGLFTLIALFNLGGLMAFGMGLLITIPMSTLIMLELYEALSASSPSPSEQIAAMVETTNN